MQCVKEVHRKEKRGTQFLKAAMIVFCVLFLIGGIAANRGLMLPCFLMAGLYFLYDYLSKKDYEYVLDGRTFSVNVIRGGRNRKTVHELNMAGMEVLAPHNSDAVAQYRRGGSEGHIRKSDYTSYEEDVPYYTMIIFEDQEKIKLLLDLDEEMIDAIRRICPGKVYKQFPQKT